MKDTLVGFWWKLSPLVRKLLLIAFMALLVGRADGQSSVTINPDCVFNFSGNATGATSSFDNRSSRCAYWRLTWEVYGAGAAVSGTFQDAPSNNAGTAAGTFVTFAGSTESGSNPSTAVNSTASFSGFYPWLRVNFTSLTGSYRGTLLGWKEPSALGGSGGGGVTSDVNIVSSITLPVDIVSPDPLPVSVGQSCTSWARINFSGTANAEIIPASGALTPIICSLVVSSDTATTIGLSRGTGVNCGTGTTVMTTFPSVLGLGLDPQSNQSTFGAAASAAICLNSTASATIGGIVFYRYE